jgi:hypothetical protein
MDKKTDAPRTTSLVQAVRIDRPCVRALDALEGNEAWCQTCGRTVRNLSAMTTDRAEFLLSTARGRLCVAYLCGRNGSPICTDRPIALLLARLRRSIAASLLPLARLLGAIGLGSLATGLSGCLLMGTGGKVCAPEDQNSQKSSPADPAQGDDAFRRDSVDSTAR